MKTTTRGPSYDQIVSMVQSRMDSNGALLDEMIRVRNHYNAEYVVPMASDVDMPEMPPMIPQLISQAIDFQAMRAASVMPYFNSPAVDPNKDRGKSSIEYAMIRRKTLAHTYYESRFDLGMARSFRHLAGYATCSLLVIPDFELKEPRVVVRDPLTSYPEPKAAEDLTPPRNAAFTFAKSDHWIRATYPEACTENGGPVPPTSGDTNTWTLLEWVDESVTVIGVLGPADDATRRRVAQNGATRSPHHIELRRWENQAGICPAVIPCRVSLDRIGSQVANLIGMVEFMAMLEALQIMATEKSIFPDRYILGQGNAHPKLVSGGGQWQDGRTGNVNIVVDANKIDELRSTPDPTNQQTIDRLERNYRTSVGLVPQAGGETYGSLRTGRGMDSMMSAAVDPRIQELQLVMQTAMRDLNPIIFEMYKGYWGGRKYHLFTGWAGDSSEFDLEPAKHIETTKTVVSYPIAGADVQGTTIQLGQMLGVKGISLATFRQRHPWIEDHLAEGERVEMEALEQACLESLMTQAVQGQIPVTYLALVHNHRKTEPNIIEAILKTDKVLSEQQAQVAPAPAEGAFAAPEQMPGLAPPGVAPVPPGEAPPGPGTIGPNEGQKGLRRLMEALSSSPPERGPVPTEQVAV